MVLSKVGGAGSLAMRSIAASASLMAHSMAGLKSATLTLSNGGTPPYEPAHSLRSGLSGMGGTVTAGGGMGAGGSGSGVAMAGGSGAVTWAVSVLRDEEQPAAIAAIRNAMNVLRMREAYSRGVRKCKSGSCGGIRSVSPRHLSGYGSPVIRMTS